MTAVPLRLGPIDAGGGRLMRSGLRWLHDDGYLCRPGEILAYCNLGFSGRPELFDGEGFDLQVALASPAAGRIRRVPELSRGGVLDRIPVNPWIPGAVWAHLERTEPGAGTPEDAELLFVAGRRLAEVAEERAGLTTGWHSRKRAWWGDGEGATLLVAGICHQLGVIRGDDGTFGVLPQSFAGPAHVIMRQAEPQAPCAVVVRETLLRTPAEAVAIREDLARSLFAAGRVPTPEGWIFLGALLAGLEPTPLDEPCDVLTRAGARRAPAVSAICLGLDAEVRHLLRHRRLGYHVNVYAYRLRTAGEAVRRWLREDFEVVEQRVEDTAEAYRQLIAAAPGCAFAILNRIASRPSESVQTYEGLDEATLAALSSLHAHDLNLMAHDLAQAPNVAIVDVEGIAADLGVAAHLPDGNHATGELQREIRDELARQLSGLGLPGWGPRPVSRY